MARHTEEIRVVGNAQAAIRALEEAGVAAERVGKSMEDKFAAHTSRIGGFFQRLSQTGSEFGLPFMGSLEKIGAKFDEAEGHGHKFFDTMAQGGKLVAAAGLAAGIAIAGESIHLADAYEKSRAQLENSLKNSGQSYDKLQGQISAIDKQQERFGSTMTQTEKLLARGVTATGSLSGAHKLLSLAQDVSAKSGKDLESSMLAVIKASEGQLRPLKMLGIDLPVAAGGALKVQQAQEKLAKAQEAAFFINQAYTNHLGGKHAPTLAQVEKANQAVKDAQDKLNTTQSAGAQIIQGLTDKLHGAASASADTFAGRIKALNAQLQDVGIKIGMVLVPILQKLMTAIADTIGWFEKHRAAAILLAGVIGGPLLVAMGAWIQSLFVADGALAFLIGPIGLVIAAVAAIGAAVYLLASNWDAVWHFIANNPWMRAMAGILTFGVSEVIRLIVTHLDDLRDVWNTVFGAMAAVAGAAAGAVSAALSPIISTLSTIVSVANAAVNAIGSLSPFGGGLASVQSLQQQAYNKLQSQPSGPQGGSRRFHAAGGVFTTPHIGVVAEAGPEAIIPLNNPGRAAQVMAAAGLGGGGGVIHNVLYLDSEVVYEALLRIQRQRGNLGFRAST